MYKGTPADAAIGISNDGRIVSIDNRTVAYFKENGDTIVKFGLPTIDWYEDSTITLGPFDPRVVYDRHADRFISVLLFASADFADSRILVSFSRTFAGDSISWYHYQFHCDSIYTGVDETDYWFDNVSIAINNEELFISTNVFEYNLATGTHAKVDRFLLQLTKADGYSGSNPIPCREWKDIQNADGNLEGSLIPVGEAYQSITYGPGCYLLSTYAGNSAKFFWYELTGNVNNPNAQIIAHLSATSFYYSVPSFLSQMGGAGDDRITAPDCAVQSGFLQNDKLHFVFNRSDNGWSEIVYAWIDPGNNSFHAETWGGAEESMNSVCPSLAPCEIDSSEENMMICFLRTGPTIFPELCVINFDTAWSPSATVVKQGEGILDLRGEALAPWDSLERIGDYTDIQRRYNSPDRACWLVGSYAAGPMPNHFGTTHGIKAWIAEVGDSMLVNRPESYTKPDFKIYPNPLNAGAKRVEVRLGDHGDRGTARIYALNGKEVSNTKFQGSAFSIQIPELPSGLYLVEIQSKKNRYAIHKLLILP